MPFQCILPNANSYLFVLDLNLSHEMIFGNLSPTSEMTFIESTFYSKLKLSKIPKIEKCITIWTLGLIPWSSNFLFIEWHLLQYDLQIYKKFRFFGLIVWIRYEFCPLFLLKNHGNLKSSPKKSESFHDSRKHAISSLK